MIRKAFKMKLKSGCKQEYKKWHDEIWPDLKDALREAGIYNYSIFLDEETNILFAVQKLNDNHNVEQLPEMDIMQRWWEYMADLREVEEDYSPIEVELQRDVSHGLTCRLRQNM